jgi:hypothetical protein
MAMGKILDNTLPCCDMRLVQIGNQTAPSELILDVSIRRTKLIGNQLDLLIVYIAPVIPSGTRIINLPLNYNIPEVVRSLRGPLISGSVAV